jgi:bifunctional enzyme CysN/CysC
MADAAHGNPAADAPKKRLLRVPDVLRLIACGGVGSGKSTLLRTLSSQTRSPSRDELPPDFARTEREHYVDADREQVFSSAANREFIVVNTRDHGELARGLASGAHLRQLAILVIDCHKGVEKAARRYSRILAFFGVKHVVLAVNKMETSGWNQSLFEAISDEYRELAEELEFSSVVAIPMSALSGANVTAHAAEAAWFSGPTLLTHLDTIAARDTASKAAPFRMSIQEVSGIDPVARGYCGRIAQGAVAVGDLVRFVPSGRESRVATLTRAHGEVSCARAGQMVTVKLTADLDAEPGEVMCSSAEPLESSNQFEVRLLWLGDHALVAGRRYIVEIHTRQVDGSVSAIKYRLDPETGSHLAARKLCADELGIVNLSIEYPMPFTPYEENHALGSLILVDRETRQTVGAGMIDFALRRAANLHWQLLSVDKQARSQLKHQAPRCIWLTGLSGSGKSTIANLLEKQLHSDGWHTFVLDGDNVRQGLNRDLGFTEADRVENLRRIAEVAKLMVEAGLVVIVSFISPYRAERASARSLFAEGEFVEVFIDTPLDECERRDPKGLYAKARAGRIANFTGIDSPYEPPEHPEVRLTTTARSAAECVEQLYDCLQTVYQSIGTRTAAE